MRTHTLQTLAALGLGLALAGCSDGSAADSAASGSPAPAPAGPALTVNQADLAAALHCPDAFDSGRNPVLLVHGTGANSTIAFGAALLPLLQQRGEDVCTVDLPDHAWQDIQISTEYVVYAARTIAQRSGRHLAVLGHSQGVAEINWAIKWWPEVEAVVDESIGLSGGYHGVDVDDNICAPHLCPPAAYQFDPTSNFMHALDAGDETPGHADYTSIYSLTDTTVIPPSQVIEGGANIAVQDLCPGRQVGHSDTLDDAVSVALVFDALDHAGPADPRRIDPAVCAQGMAPGVDTQQENDNKKVIGPLLYAATLPEAGLVTSEPPLAPYAQSP